MKSTVTLSVIIPIYNAENTLRACVKSVLRQSFDDCEILLIDDGSTDESGKISDELSLEDNRIKVFHKPNRGVSSARNLGLDNAAGQWIAFLDSDDEMVKICDIHHNDADLILGTIEVCRPGEKTSIQRFHNGLLERNELTEFLRLNLQQHTFSSCCAKFINRRIIGVTRFDESMKFGEDTVFMLNCIKRVHNIRIDDELWYRYLLLSKFENKYQQMIPDSIYALKKIFGVYDLLGIRNLDFERNVFTTYKNCCQQEIYKHPERWYNDAFVKDLYSRVSRVLGFRYRLSYLIMSSPKVAQFVIYIRKGINCLRVIINRH